MKNKSIIALTVAGLLVSGTAYAAVNGFYKGYQIVNVKVDGKTVEGDVPAILFDNRTMVPLRFVTNAMGGTIAWDEKTQTASVTSKPTSFYNIGINRKLLHLEGQTKVNIYYPEIAGLANNTVQTHINNLLKDATTPKPAASDEPSVTTTYTGDFSVTYQHGNIVDILFDTYVYPEGAAHGMPYKTSLIVNLQTGDTYTLKDLVHLNSDAYAKLTDLIKKKDYNKALDTFKPWEGFHDQTDYDMYLEYGGIVIEFPPYEFASYAQGFLSYHISWNELQELGILNTDGAAWSSLGYSTTY